MKPEVLRMLMAQDQDDDSGFDDSNEEELEMMVQQELENSQTASRNRGVGE